MTMNKHFFAHLDEKVDMLTDFVHFLVGGCGMVFPVIVQIADLFSHEHFRVVGKAGLRDEAISA